MPHYVAHPLDGAMLYFQPETGTCVRVENEATRDLTRKAPRVVMFGITNACNLSCEFCSRDTTRASTWTVGSAEEILVSLAEAGTLEVAFGGGEPFAFAGLAELCLRLRRRTRLALNVTTNGTLLDDAKLRSFEGTLGQVRLSLYDDIAWRPTAQTLFRAGQLWGANVLVHDRMLQTLPALLCELAALGAHDVSLLSYVGNDASLMLSHASERDLAKIIEASPITVRVSVCFGARLSVPTLFDAVDEDCGAGLDFLSITPDRRAQSCSFQDQSFPITNAEEALALWKHRQDALRRPSPRQGCTRASTSTSTSTPTSTSTSTSTPTSTSSSIHVWRSFSGNNSGECFLVSWFESPADATRFLLELEEGFVSGAPYGAPWRELFERERVARTDSEAGSVPDEMITAGRVFLARTEMAPGDEFPELRGLAWKRGGAVVAGGVHVHGRGEANVLAVIAAHDKRDAAAIVLSAENAGFLADAYGDEVFVVLADPSEKEARKQAPADRLRWRRDQLRQLAQERPQAMELAFEEIDRAVLTDTMKKLGSPTADKPRLALGFWAYEDHSTPVERAKAIAAELDGNVVRVNNLVLVDDIVRHKRGAVLGYRRNATVTALGGETVACFAQLAHPPHTPTKGKKTEPYPPLDVDALRPELLAHLRTHLGARPFELVTCDAIWGGRASIRVHTSAPADVLAALASYAELHELFVHLGVADVDPLLRSLRRLRDDVRAAR